MISINLEYCRNNEQTYLKNIEFALVHDELLLIDLLEGSTLWPLDNIKCYGNHKTLFNIVKKSKNKRIIYLCADLNIYQRIKKWKHLLEFDVPKLDVICFPFSSPSPQRKTLL